MTSETEQDWAALLLRVRDDADRGAFALLFRHFAPRIKAFLRKSGANEPLAEECAQEVMATIWHKAHMF
ncbi:MAG: RNA polymerase subunit sigma, partial [Rhodobacter sp.]